MTQKENYKSSQQSSNAINYQAVSVIPQRPNPLSHLWDYSSHPEERHSKQNTGTLGVSKSKKGTPDLPIIQTKSDRRTGSLSNDKRKDKLTRRSNNPFPPLLHINSITMASSPNQEQTNNGEDFHILLFAPPTTVENVIDITQEPFALTAEPPRCRTPSWHKTYYGRSFS